MKYLSFCRKILIMLYLMLGQSVAQSGLTDILPQARSGNFRIVGVAEDYQPAGHHLLQMGKQLSDDWVLLQAVEIDHYLPAGSFLSAAFDPLDCRLGLTGSAVPANLSAEAEAAIRKSPSWLRNDLRLKFRQLSVEKQRLWAGLINAVNDPIIDEVAFSVAHLSAAYLSSTFAQPGLIEKNARIIYENDTALDYVRIVNYGSSLLNEDYYSTTIYRTFDGVAVREVEAPREIYYWYVVHPRVSSEIPGYVDPDVIEENYTHDNNLVAAGQGYFWRDFLFNYADEGMPVLKDLMARTAVVWDGTQGANKGKKHAMGRLNEWLAASMPVFDATSERPHQPVRIYRKHMGRCGENSDIRNAAARAALIPCTAVASYSTDHVWNEFWSNEWIHWDNEIDRQLMYQNEWGKVFGTVFETRSDGYMTAVTDKYTHGVSDIFIYVLDKDKSPVDGAVVYLYTKEKDHYLFDTYGITDTEGKVAFLVGKNRAYAARVSSALGNMPADPNQLITIVNKTISGRDYSKSITLSAARSAIPFRVKNPPLPDNPGHKLVVNVETDMQLLHGTSLFDDLGHALGQSCMLYREHGPGRFNVYLSDSTNYRKHADNREFEMEGFWASRQKIDLTWDLPPKKYYTTFSNEQCLANVQHLKGTVELYGQAEGNLTQTLELVAGWNWISLNTEPADGRLQALFGPAGAAIRQVVGQEQAASNEQGNGWTGDLVQLEPGKGYLVEASDAVRLTITGQTCSASAPVELKKGWNWVGFINRCALPLREAVAALDGRIEIIKGQYRSAVYDDSLWVGDLKELIPGNFYKIKMAEPALWKLPQDRMRLAKRTPDWQESWDLLPGARDNMILISRVKPALSFDHLRIVDNEGTCRAVGTPCVMAGDTLWYFTVVGNRDNETLYFESYNSLSGEISRMGPRLIFHADELQGDPDRPLNDFRLVLDNYPDPFNSSTTIPFYLKRETRVQIEIFDALGRRVAGIETGLRSAGYHNDIVWNGRSSSGELLPSALYFYRIRTDYDQQVSKMLLIR